MFKNPRALIVMGVSGSGKTTVGALLARQLGWEFLEGDSLHSTENVERMRSGTPLGDAQRAPWLSSIAEWMTARFTDKKNVVVTCSALAKRYRDVLRGEGVVFVHLNGTREVIEERLTARQGHFMGPGLLDSQLATLEPLEADESQLIVDMTLNPEAAAERVITALRL
ncbi:gluconokinase [Lysinibacter sp. HNR]|uniref:gluconokinase n=1 Tax=Lysinibacter sp. HNR TaxID=3031408 RepID=UPI002434D90F|nr:gluconokinase [Lysinibacter sp. HNR]WGD36781.1 gluconokinase [Lysinibacter sp. HNR]